MVFISEHWREGPHTPLPKVQNPSGIILQLLSPRNSALFYYPRSWKYTKLCVSVCFSTITLWNFIYFLCLFLMKRRQCVKNLHSDFLVKTVKMVKKGGRSVIYENSHRRHRSLWSTPLPQCIFH